MSESKDYKMADQLYQKAMKMQPDGIDAINALIVCKKLMKTEIDDTLLNKALKAVEKHPKHFLTLFNISLIYLEKSNYESAHEYLTRAYKIQNTNQQLLYNLAFWKQELKDYKGAIELYNKIIEKDPNHHKAITHVAICLHYQGDTEDAANRIKTWIENGTPDAKLYVNMGILMKKMKKYKEALDYFDKSMKHTPNFHAIYNTATLYYEKQDYDESLEWFIKARENTRPEKSEYKFSELGMAAVYEKLKNYDEAIAIYMKYDMKDKIDFWNAAQQPLNSKTSDDEEDKLDGPDEVDSIPIPDHIEEEKQTKHQRDLEEAKKQAIKQKEIKDKKKQEADQKAQQEAEIKAKKDAEIKSKREAELKALKDAELKAKKEAELKAQQELEAQQQAEKEAKLLADKKAKDEHEQKLKEEQDHKLKEEQEQKLKEEQEKKAKEEKAKKDKEEQEAKVKADQEKKLKAEQEQKVKEEQEKKLKEEQEKRLKDEYEIKLKEENAKKLKYEEEKRLKEEQDAKRVVEEEGKKHQQDEELKMAMQTPIRVKNDSHDELNSDSRLDHITQSSKHIKNKESELRIDKQSINNSRIEIDEDFDPNIEEDKVDPTFEIKEDSDEDSDIQVADERIPRLEENQDDSCFDQLKDHSTNASLMFKCALACMRKKQWDEALAYIKKTQVLEPDYQKSKILEATADIYFNLKNQQFEKVQELYDKAIYYLELEHSQLNEETDKENMLQIKYDIGIIFIKKGKCYEKMKMLDKAIEMYHESLEHDNTNPLAYLRVGWAYVMKNQIYDGYHYLKKGLKFRKNSIELLIKLSETILMINDSKAKERQSNALKYIDLWLEKEPENVEALILLGRIKEKQNMFDDSFNAFEKAISIDTKRTQAYYYLGQLFEKRKEIKRAIVSYKQWLSLDKNHFAWAISLATLLGNEGEHHKAAKYFKHAVDINPNSIVARFGLGKTIQNTSENKEAAISHFEFVLSKEPENYKAYWQLAIVYLDKSEYDKSWEMVKKWLSINKKYVLGLVTMGNLLFETGNPSQSIKYHKKALSYNPKDIQALIGLGNSLYEAGEPANAISYYKKAIEIDESLSDVHYNLGNAMYLIEDTDGAIKHYRIAIKLNPQKPESYYNLGNALWVKSDYEQAIEYYRKAIELDEYNAPAFYNLGNAYYMISEFEKAIKTYQKALKLNPESAECHFNIASAYNDKGDYLNALHHYNQSLRYDQGNIETMICIVQTCKHLGKLDEAKKIVKRIKEIDPSNDISLDK